MKNNGGGVGMYSVGLNLIRWGNMFFVLFFIFKNAKERERERISLAI